MLIGAASFAHALSAEFGLLTGMPTNRESLVAEHVAALERIGNRATPVGTSIRSGRSATGGARRWAQ